MDRRCPARFEVAWQAGLEPEIEDFVPAESPDQGGRASIDILLPLVGIDLAWRWKTAGAAGRQTTAKAPLTPCPSPGGRG